MDRREFLAEIASLLGTVGVAGCAGRQSPARATPTDTPTGTPLGGTSDTGTPTPVPFPDTCGPLPDVDGLPARPAEWTADSVRSYVIDFERVYAVATKSEYSGIATLRVTHTETIGDRYRVQLEVEGEPTTPTPNPDGSTPTPMPADASAHRALYRVEGDRLLRELRGHAGGRRLSSDCWTLSGREQ